MKSSTQRQSNQETIAQLWQQAKDLQAEGKSEAALKVYRSILELDDRHLPSLHQVAQMCEKLGTFDEAIEVYQKAIEVDDEPPFWVYRHLGFALSQKGEFEAATESYRQAIALQMDDVATYNLLGQVRGKLGDLEGAVSSYGKAIELQPEQPSWVYLNFAEALERQGHNDRAIAAYERALALEPENEGIRRLLEVVTARKEASEVDRTELAQQLQQQGKLDEALAEYRAVLAEDGSNLAALHQVAKICESQGKWDEAVEAYRKAVEVDAEPPFWVYRHLGFALSQQGDLDGAVEVYEKAIELNPEDEATQSLLEYAYKKKENLNGKIEQKQHSPTITIESTVDSDVRLIAFYLPQFHPIPENDRWWGKGFTEWTNVTKAKPLFEGHYQPHLPADLGFYDLRLPEVREAQAELARQYGIYGFCYYFYWFAGKRLLDRPLDEMLESKKPDFPFCLCWANENWSRRWDGLDNDILIAQDHSEENDRAFAESVIPYFQDARYIRVNGKPLLIIYRANIIPEIKKTLEYWRVLFRANGIGEVYLCATLTFGLQDAVSLGFDGEIEFPPNTNIQRDEIDPSELNIHDFEGKIYDYKSLALNAIKQPLIDKKRFLSVTLSWDNTARKGNKAHIYHNFSLSTYEFWLQSNIQKTKINFSGDERLVFINAWNEWGEGAHLEPDRQNGHSYLESTKKSFLSQDNWAIYVNLIQSYKENDYLKLEKILVAFWNSLLKHKSNTELIVEALEEEKLVFEKLSKSNDDSLEWTLETPATGENLASNFTVSGWIVSKEYQPIALEVIHDGLIIQQIPVDGFRQDVKDYFHKYQSNNNYFNQKIKLFSLDLSKKEIINLNINVIFRNGNNNEIGVLYLKRSCQNLSTLKNLPNLTQSCLNLVTKIEYYLHQTKPILFILHDIAVAGAQLFLVRQLEWIAKQSCSIRFQVLVNIQKKQIPTYGKGGQEILDRLEKVCPIYFLEETTHLPENISKIQSNHYNLIYANTSVLGDLLESIGKINVRVIVHIHELYFWIKYRLGIDRFNRYLKYYPKFIACSNAVKDNLVNNLNVNLEQIEVIHAYVPVQKLINSKTKSREKIRQELNLTKDTFVLASCGTLDWRKGADLLVALVVLLKERLSTKKFVYLWIGGFIDERAKSEIDFTIKKAELEENIRLLGHQTNPINYLNAADVFVLLSKEDPFPLVMSEAAACQIPTVGFDESGGVTEFVGTDAGLLAPYLNLEVMADNIKMLYDNPQQRQEMGENAFRKINELYDEDVLAPKVVQLIQSLIQESRQADV